MQEEYITGVQVLGGMGLLLWYLGQELGKGFGGVLCTEAGSTVAAQTTH